jgi:hypothetical protein
MACMAYYRDSFLAFREKECGYVKRIKLHQNKILEVLVNKGINLGSHLTYLQGC